MELQSPSWEYASEMIIKSRLLKLKSTEVPINFYKDQEGRQSHHKRTGWFSPWHAGWINLKVMLLYAPNQMIVKPGLFFLVLGLLLILMQINGPVTIVDNITLSISTMIIGLTIAVLGFSCIQMGILVASFSRLNEYFKNNFIKFLEKYFTYTRGMITGGIFFLTGIVLSSNLLFLWLEQGFQLKSVAWYIILGFLMSILGIQTILFNLAYQTFMMSKGGITSLQNK